MRPGNASDANSTWFGPGVMQIAHGAPGAIVPVGSGRLRADRGARVRINRNIDRDLPQKFSISVEHLYAAIPAIRHIHISCGVHGDAVRRVELSRARSPGSPQDFSQLPSLSTFATRELM